MNAPALASAHLGFLEIAALDPAAARDVDAAWWPIGRLGEGLEELARAARLARGSPGGNLTPPPAEADEATLAHWFDWAAGQLGLEAEAVEASAAHAEAMLSGAGPAVVLHATAQGRGFLLLLGGRAGRLRLIGPDLKARACPLESLRAALCWAHEAPLEPELTRLLDLAGVGGQRRRQVHRAILRERLAGSRVGGVWMLRLPASAPLWTQLRRVGAPRNAAAVLGAFAVVYGLEILGWTLIGGAALNGRLDFGWLTAWLLLVLSAVPWKLAGSWFQSAFALDVGRVVKSRLLAGALAADPDKVARQGVGHLIGRVIEAQALESLALGGGMAVVVGGLELALGAWVLSHGGAGAIHLTLLTAGVAAVAWLLWRSWRRLREFTLKRLALTNSLIEGMVGHRTRLAQERPGRRDAVEDKALRSYVESAEAVDRSGVALMAAAPSAWMLIGLAGLIPAFVRGGPLTPAALAISLGGMLIVQRALTGISGGLSSLTRALIAWRQVSTLVGESQKPPEPRPFLSVGQMRRPAGRAALLGAQGLVFRYDPAGEAVVAEAAFTIAAGERILLEGRSGGGKSTLAALLTGLKTPQSGLLLLNGLDRHTLGDDWRRLVTAAPQFHENHVLTGPLAFNLLMGRAWPARAADLAEAEALCEELGLGDLLRRMPAGIMQRVGETGWQLSHGERSRIFLARALLQGAELTILDESFAALDPATLELCLKTTLRRAKALLVIAHP